MTIPGRQLPVAYHLITMAECLLVSTACKTNSSVLFFTLLCIFRKLLGLNIPTAILEDLAEVN